MEGEREREQEEERQGKRERVYNRIQMLYKSISFNTFLDIEFLLTFEVDSGGLTSAGVQLIPAIGPSFDTLS